MKPTIYLSVIMLAPLLTPRLAQAAEVLEWGDPIEAAAHAEASQLTNTYIECPYFINPTPDRIAEQMEKEQLEKERRENGQPERELTQRERLEKKCKDFVAWRRREIYNQEKAKLLADPSWRAAQEEKQRQLRAKAEEQRRLRDAFEAYQKEKKQD
jgi:hypothetical protein